MMLSDRIKRIFPALSSSLVARFSTKLMPTVSAVAVGKLKYLYKVSKRKFKIIYKKSNQLTLEQFLILRGI
jgi:ribosomal protein S7